MPGDIGNPDTVRKIFHTIAKTCDHLDVLVNNAGISHIGLLMDMTDEDWDKVLSSNLSSVFYCCRAAIPPMLSHGSGRIINISSMWGTVGASCEAAYSATKSGMNGLTKALAKELAPSNVQVNAIACGVIDTAMNAQFSEEEREALREEIPRRTLCRQRGSGCAGAHPCIRSFLPDRTDHWPGRRLYLIWKYVIKEFSLC